MQYAAAYHLIDVVAAFYFHYSGFCFHWIILYITYFLSLGGYANSSTIPMEGAICQTCLLCVFSLHGG